MAERGLPPLFGAPWERKEEVDRHEAEVQSLIAGAQDAAQNRHWGSALWRLVDAAGLIGSFMDLDAQGLAARPTGRGYYVAKGYRKR